MIMTTHASVRSQQRGVPPMLVDLLLRFGSEEAAPGGARKVFFDKPARRRLQAYAGPMSRLLDEHLGVYAVIVRDGTVITIGHRTERVRRH